MHCSQARRGRPRGTGIDDSGRLREIAAMIAEDPELKPTTAIKNIGVSDPSTIRRLRDKFNSKKEFLLRELEPCNRQEPQVRVSHSRDSAEARTVPLKHSREPSRSEEVQKATKEKSEQDCEEESRKSPFLEITPNEVMRRMISDGLRSASAVFHFQLVIATHTFHSPMMRSALRYQLAFSQALLGFSGPQPADSPSSP